ncbi:hypothetical protein GHK61_04260 [Sinorhizobium meliloti]|nr:hypothetical protein [Sinorhizobium meliloti]MQX55768.1 hypothetical protein [Sinorhizobium meliloti]
MAVGDKDLDCSGSAEAGRGANSSGDSRSLRASRLACSLSVLKERILMYHREAGQGAIGGSRRAWPQFLLRLPSGAEKGRAPPDAHAIDTCSTRSF